MSLDNFQIISKLSQHVYKVKRIQDNKIYALKQVPIDHLTQKQIQNAINEVRFLASIRHPNVVCYKQAFYDPNSHSICIVTQYAEGGDLLSKIFELTKKGDHFTQQRVWEIFLQILKGLNAIHHLKIAHRDLKSSNIMLGRNGIIKVGDFNVSIVLGKGMMCHNQTGTPYYASPEVIRDESYNSKSDMWSLGCILFQIMHFKPPFRARDMEGLSQKIQKGFYGKIDRKYSQQLSEILKLLLNIDPFERYSCQQMLSHPIIKDKLRHGKTVQSLQTSHLLKTIRPSKNMIYLTDKLPKPNYVPVRYRSFFQLKDHEAPHKIYGSSMKQISTSQKLSKSLNKSQFVSHKRNEHSLQRSHRFNQSENPQWLPKITNKRVKLY